MLLLATYYDWLGGTDVWWVMVEVIRIVLFKVNYQNDQINLPGVGKL